jgi:hypothetical protein
MSMNKPGNLEEGRWAPPAPKPGFETGLVEEVNRLMASLPSGAARLRVGRIPGRPQWPEPYFEITPGNPRSAPLKGSAVAKDLNLIVGHSWREFYGFAHGGTVIRGATWQEELREIWLAVVAGQLTERLFMDSSGRVIAWNSHLRLDGKDLVFRNGRREKLFGRAYTTARTVTYEPYVSGIG